MSWALKYAGDVGDDGGAAGGRGAHGVVREDLVQRHQVPPQAQGRERGYRPLWPAPRPLEDQQGESYEGQLCLDGSYEGLLLLLVSVTVDSVQTVFKPAQSSSIPFSFLNRTRTTTSSSRGTAPLRVCVCPTRIGSPKTARASPSTTPPPPSLPWTSIGPRLTSPRTPGKR